MTIRLLVCDVDGTLVDSDKRLPDVVVEAAGRWQAAGLLLSVISARPPSGLGWIAERLRLTGAYGAFNGGTVLGPDGAVLLSERLVPEVARRTLALIDRPGVTPWLFHEGRWHATGLDPVHAPREVKAANQQAVLVDDLRPLADAADKIVAVSDDHDMLAALEREVADALGGEATVARSAPYYLDVTAPAANKGDGVSALARAAGVDLADTAVIGDQRNDLPMFDRAGFSVAMGQGPEEVRGAADAVTRSNDEAGVAWAIDRLLLPRVSGEGGET